MKKIATSLLAICVMFTGVLVTLPANAALASNCTVLPEKPFTDGVYVHSKTVIKCEHTVPIWVRAVTVGAHNQEQVGPVWVNRGSWKYVNSAPAYTLNTTATTRCNGHGTDNWRNRGYGRDENNGEKYVNGPVDSLTC